MEKLIEMVNSTVNMSSINKHKTQAMFQYCALCMPVNGTFIAHVHFGTLHNNFDSVNQPF